MATHKKRVTSVGTILCTVIYYYSTNIVKSFKLLIVSYLN